MFFNYKKRKNKNKNKWKNSSSKQSYSIGSKQMEAITNAVIFKKRLFVFTENM